MAKKSKAAPAKRKRTPMKHVISFRLTDDQYKKLTAIHGRQSIPFVKSVRQLCRKLVCDYGTGKLVYPNEADKFDNSAACGG